MKKKTNKTFQGHVVSASMDKTIVVSVVSQKKHPIYLKYYKVTRKYYVHDAKNIAKKGDTVIISASKPISKTKRWILDKVIK